MDCQRLHARYEKWFESLKDLYTGPLHTSTTSYTFAPEDESPDGAVFPSFLSFPDLATAQTIINYWGSFLVLQTTAASNTQELQAAGTPIPPSSPHEVENGTEIANQIAQAAPYCLQERFKTAGPVVILHTFSGAMQYFEHIGAEREVRWCREVFAKMNVGGNPFEDRAGGVDEDNDETGMVLGGD